VAFSGRQTYFADFLATDLRVLAIIKMCSNRLNAFGIGIVALGA